jgi:mRNA interferase MazF
MPKMPPTTRYSRGDVVLVPFPFTDLTTTKQRPALVISPDRLNATRDDVVLVAITSQLPAAVAEDECLLSVADLPGTGLLKPSVLKLGKMVTIHQGLVRRKVGALPAPFVAKVLGQLQRLFSP